MGGACSTYGGRGKALTGFWWENLRKSDRLVNPGVDGITVLRWICRKLDVEVWTGWIWFRIGKGGEHL
jgi:hypothetical protein